MTDANTTKYIANLKRLFDQGEISATWAGLQPLLMHDLAAEHDRMCAYLQLGCALYKTGDLEAAKALNRARPLDDFTLMRYRLSLRLGDISMAKRLRLAPNLPKNAEADFRTSAGLHCLWAHKYRMGFKLYQSRSAAVNFGQIIPQKLVYTSLPKHSEDDLKHIALEQGVGEVLLCLAHLKAQGGNENKHFLAEQKYRSLVNRVFPKARFSAFETLNDDWAGTRVQCAADYLARGFAQTDTFAPQTYLASPSRPPFMPPAVGICWRGGSGQNRREERHIPLAYFLDQLPKGMCIYIPLQFDLTAKETRLLDTHPDCQTAIFDIRENPEATLSLIRQMAGVISVDSANLHFAGLSDVPLLAVMNKTAHWFWGPRADVKDVYRSAQTLARADVAPGRVRSFVTDALESYSHRATSKRRKPGAVDRPIFVLGLPRSGTSMTTRILERHGVWLGKTVQGSRDNPHGFFENRALRDRYVKGILKWIGADPLGVKSLPDLDRLPLYPHLRFQILQTLLSEGYTDGPWAFKDPKLTLIWPIFTQTFPDASWLIVRRDQSTVIDSLCRTPFMARHSSSPHFWEGVLQSYNWRLERLKKSGAAVYEISSDELHTGDMQCLPELLETHGVAFDPSRADRSIDSSLLTPRKKAAPRDDL